MKGFKDVIILFLITTISGLCLSVVYNITQAKIETAKALEVENALKKVAPFMTGEFEMKDFDFNGETVPVFVAKGDSGSAGAGLKITNIGRVSAAISFF